MLLIIDGYNVLKYSVGAHQASEQEKKRFIAMIVSYANIKDLAIELVFDGGPLGVADCWQHDERVRICHSGAKESADVVIERRLKDLKGREMLLISTDRALGRAAAGYGVESLDSADFYQLLQVALHKEHPHERSQKGLVKTGSTRNPELDALIAEHAEIIRKGIDEEVKREPEQHRTRSKHEKRLEKLLRKL